jgi:hypothetical protein
MDFAWVLQSLDAMGAPKTNICIGIYICVWTSKSKLVTTLIGNLQGILEKMSKRLQFV